MDTLTTAKLTKSGAFLIEETAAQDIFIPEEFTEEQRMIREACETFVAQEVEPVADEMDNAKDNKIAISLLEKTGDLGFLGIGVPEAYGGTDDDFTTGVCFTEIMTTGYSFALTVGVQTSIGIAPILLYANEEQKAKYLPKLVTGEWKTCYCLTEPSSGSDANSAKTKAVLSEDGTHYTLNGQKMWITNGGWSNIFIVFAKVEGDKYLSAFIVEKAFGGVTVGAEEKKMGIKGSSTCQVFLNNVKVPVENMLGERGRGFKMAVNVLNTGRIKLAAGAIGVGRKTIDFAVNYANERIQFGMPISKFGAIKHKLAQMATKVYILESGIYRTSGNIDRNFHQLVEGGLDPLKAKAQAVEDYAIECALLKVFGSEAQGFIVDEGVQIYGGMGFSAETPMDKLYRDSRITRIFEGTNEINRMLVVDMMLRKAMKGQLDLMTAAQQVAGELMSIPSFGGGSDEMFAEEKKVLRNLKKAVLMVAGSGVQKLMAKLKTEQEVLMHIADMTIQVYMLESALLRTEKLITQGGEEKYALQVDMVRIFLHEAANIVNMAGKEALYAFAEGDELRMMLMGLKRFTKVQPFNLKLARRRVAKAVIAENKYCFTSY